MYRKNFEKLSERQRKFVENYLICKSGAEAARKSGYGAAGAGVRACELLARSDIQEAIAQRRSRLAEETDVSPEKVVEKLLQAYYLADNAKEMVLAVRELRLLMGYGCRG